MASIITTQEHWTGIDDAKVETRDNVVCVIWEPKPGNKGMTFDSIEQAREWLRDHGYTETA